MENDDPIVLELEARLAEACCVGTESTLTEIRGRALAALEPMFAEHFAKRMEPAFPTAAEDLRHQAQTLRGQAATLDRRQTP